MESIFKGPSFYEEKDKRYFLGRDKEAEDLLYLVENSDFSVCYAESGEGKSSLINAGLQPRMREKGLFPIRITFNENDFTRTPANIDVDEKDPDRINFDQLIWDKIWETIYFARNTDLFGDLYKTLTIQSSTITEDKVECRETVWWKLRYNELRINSYENITPVLIFDQFEEVFTRSKDIGWTDSFFKWLEELYRDDRYENVFVEGGRTKMFKVLLSLRSDYVCELDYWCMNKHFIPSLKNNRYCLKPLSKHSAYMIVKQLVDLPKGVNYDDIIKSAKIERSGDWKDIDNTLPCISALVLSLVLTGLDEGDDDITAKLNELIQENKENISDDFFFFVMNHIYEKALEKSGIGKKSTLRDILEESLVDTNGRRRVVSRLDKNLQSIPERIITKLAKERIIIVSGMNVEISHDCLRKVIEKHNAERQRELEKEKRKSVILRKSAERLNQRVIRQKHNVYAFLLLFLSFAASYLFLRIHSYNIIVPFICGKGEFALVTKELMCVISIAIIPVGAILYLYNIRWGKSHIRDIISMCLFLLFVYSIFVMVDSVFCPVDRYFSTCGDSAIVLFIVPLLYYSIFLKRPLWHYLLYAMLLMPIVINAYGKWQISFGVLFFYLCIVSLFLIYSFFTCKTRVYNKQHRFLIRLFWSASCIIVLIATVSFQLGFNFFAIDYNKVQRDNLLSRGWKTIVVRNGEKSGLLNAQSGSIILPCVFDSIFHNVRNSEHSFLYIPDSVNVNHATFGEIGFEEKSGTDSVKVKLLISPEFEYILGLYRSIDYKRDNLQDSIKEAAALMHSEYRNIILECLQNGKKPNFNALHSYHILDSLHKEQTCRMLNYIKHRRDSLNDHVINNLYKAIYSDLCLCTIKDRFINEDLSGIIKVFSVFNACEFQTEQSRIFLSHYSYSDDNYSINFSNSDLVGNNSYAHSGLLHIVSGIDMQPHAESILDRIKTDNASLNSLTDSIIKTLRVVNISNYYISVLAKMKKGQSYKEATNNTLIQLIGGVNKQISRLDALDQAFTYNFIESEVSFKQLTDTVLHTLIPIIDSGACVNYNSSLIDICRELIKVSVCRWYMDGEKYVQTLKDADDRRKKQSYKLIEDIVDAVNVGKNGIKDRKKQIKLLTNDIVHKAEQQLIDTY